MLQNLAIELDLYDLCKFFTLMTKAILVDFIVQIFDSPGVQWRLHRINEVDDLNFSCHFD